MVDRVQALKLEDPATGGTETDLFTTATDANEDFLDARGVTHQNTTSDDDAVRTGRDALDNLTLTDPVSGTATLAALLAGGFDVNSILVDDVTLEALADDVTANLLVNA